MTERTTTGHGAAQDAPGAPRARRRARTRDAGGSGATEAPNGTQDTPRANQGNAQCLVVVMPLPALLLTVNQREKMHWRARSDEIRNQRTMAKMHTMQRLPPEFTPFVGTVWLDVEVRPHPRMKEPDYGGKWQAIKAIEDGLQDAGVFAGGDDKVVKHGTMVWNKAQRTGEVILTLRGRG